MAVAWHIRAMHTISNDGRKARKKAADLRKTIEVTRGSTTVKIYRVKNRNRDLFMITWFVGGRRHRKNFADEKIARHEAAMVADKLNRGQAQSVSLTGADRDEYLQARQELAPLGIPLYAAVKDYVAAARLLNGKPLLSAVQFYLSHEHQELPEKRVSDLYEEFLDQQQKNGRSVRYIQDIKSRLRRFADAFRMNIGEVTTAAMEEWLEDLEVSPRTRLNFRTLLITFFKFAQKRKYLPKDQLTAADDLEVPTTHDEAIEIYTHAELQKLIQHSDAHTLPVLCFGAFAGLRTAEIERLAWDCVLDEEIEIRAKTAKTRSRRLVPILPPLAKALRSIRKRDGLVVNHIKLQYRMRELADAAKVPRKANGLRHSFASYRMAAVKNASQVADEMGNSPAMIFEHYRELVRKADAEKWWNENSWSFPQKIS